MQRPDLRRWLRSSSEQWGAFGRLSNGWGYPCIRKLFSLFKADITVVTIEKVSVPDILTSPSKSRKEELCVCGLTN